MEKKQRIDYYEELEVDRDATQEQIREAYKRLALKWHPDKNGNSAESNEKFKRIGEAYAVLSNKKKRREYDEFGHIDENDEEFAEFLNNLDFMDLASELLGDLLSFNGLKKAKGKKKFGKKKGGRLGEKLAEEMFSSLLFACAMGDSSDLEEYKEEESKGKAKDEESDNSWETDEEVEVK